MKENKLSQKNLSTYNNSKRFSVILINPPYSGTMHLKFLEKIIQISDKVINISPCGWLLDIPAVLGWKKTTFQRFEDNVGKHIKSLEILGGDNVAEGNKYFNIFGFEKIGIYELDNNEHDIYSTVYLEDKRKSMDIFNKTIKLVYEKKIDNLINNIKVSSIHGHPGQRDEFDVVTPQYKLVEKLKPRNMTENEFKNWHNSCNTKFMKYCNLLTRQGQNTHPELLPFMCDYSRPWTDERFYNYFNLTDEERKLINKTMEIYIYIKEADS